MKLLAQLFLSLALFGCASDPYDGGNFYTALDELVDAASLDLLGADRLRREGKCIEVMQESVVAEQGAFRRGDLENAAKEVDGRLTKVGANAYTVLAYRWIDKEGGIGTLLHLSFVGFRCDIGFLS